MGGSKEEVHTQKMRREQKPSEKYLFWPQASLQWLTFNSSIKGPEPEPPGSTAPGPTDPRTSAR